MSLKWLFWTGLLAVLVFFSVIYFGIKYEWVGESRPSTAKSQTKLRPSTNPETNLLPSSQPLAGNTTSGAKGNGVGPELIDELDATSDSKVLGAVDLSIEEVVSECQKLSESIGIPESRLEQAISECVDRNSTHLASDNGNQAADERETLIREQCSVAITQKDLLSADEIKMLVDECVASMSTD